MEFSGLGGGGAVEEGEGVGAEGGDEDEEGRGWDRGWRGWEGQGKGEGIVDYVAQEGGEVRITIEMLFCLSSLAFTRLDLSVAQPTLSAIEDFCF